MIAAFWILAAVLWLCVALLLLTFDRYGSAAVLLLLCFASVGVALLPAARPPPSKSEPTPTR